MSASFFINLIKTSTHETFGIFIYVKGRQTCQKMNSSVKNNKIPEERKRYLPIPYEELAQLGLSAPIPACLQRMRIFEFDTAEYPFREAMAEILDVCPENLETLHHTEEGRRALEEGEQQK